MKLSRRTLILASLLLLAFLALASRLLPSATDPAIDQHLVNTAAANSRAAAAYNPPPRDDPPPQGSFAAPMVKSR